MPNNWSHLPLNKLLSAPLNAWITRRWVFSVELPDFSSLFASYEPVLQCLKVLKGSLMIKDLNGFQDQFLRETHLHRYEIRLEPRQHSCSHSSYQKNAERLLAAISFHLITFCMKVDKENSLFCWLNKNLFLFSHFHRFYNAWVVNDEKCFSIQSGHSPSQCVKLSFSFGP